LALAGILAAVATPQYRNWRANSINAEAVTAVEQAIAVSRQQAKRTGTDVTLSLSGDQSTVLRGAQVIEIPNGGTIQTGGAPIALTFVAPLGSQAPFDIVTFD